tara:strand:- start:1580 stop:1723 length:144 start_codon:yes stop_codon:yes gene_type:complete
MNILTILSMDQFYGESEVIEIAKGKHQLPLTLRGLINKYKRKRYGKR